MSKSIPMLAPALSYNPRQCRKVDPRISHLRASEAGFFDSDGFFKTQPENTPRLRLSAEDSLSGGLLLERGATNLIAYSNDFTNTTWVKRQATVVVSDIDSPLGGKAFRLSNTAQESAIASGLTCSIGAVAANQKLTFSIIVRPDTRNHIRISVNPDVFGDTRILFFDLTTGQTRVDSAYEVISHFEKLSNGWVRVSWSSSVLTAGECKFLILIGSSMTNTPSTGEEGQWGILLAGAQCEIGLNPTTHISTNGSQVSRASERHEFAVSDEINEHRGTYFVEFTSAAHPTWCDVLVIIPKSRSNNKRATLTFSSIGTLQFGFNGSGTVEFLEEATPQAKRFKVAVSYDSSKGYTMAVNGKVGSYEGAFSPEPVGAFTIGSSMGENPGSNLNGTLHELRYYSEPFDEQMLVALTS